MIDECTKNISGKAPTPGAKDLFSDWKVEPLPKVKASEFHTIVSKGLFDIDVTYQLINLFSPW